MSRQWWEELGCSVWNKHCTNQSPQPNPSTVQMNAFQPNPNTATQKSKAGLGWKNKEQFTSHFYFPCFILCTGRVLLLCLTLRVCNRQDLYSYLLPGACLGRNITTHQSWTDTALPASSNEMRSVRKAQDCGIKESNSTRDLLLLSGRFKLNGEDRFSEYTLEREK